MNNAGVVEVHELEDIRLRKVTGLNHLLARFQHILI